MFYRDEGSNTLGNIANAVGGIELPNLKSLGLGNITDIKGVPRVSFPTASHGKLKEVSKGKDSTTGHWELGGLILDFDFSYFPDGFPIDMMMAFLKETGCKGYLGNIAASGTEIIQQLGDKHVKTGFPIIYTSADSVFQIAAHEDVIPLDRLYKICEITRHKILKDPYKVGRVIARPFVGSSGKYKRTTNRRDFSMDPPDDTIIDILKDNDINTIGIGKIDDLFNGRGLKVKDHTKSNLEGCNKIESYLKKQSNSFIFANLVDFDVYFGHRNDPKGFGNALKDFDRFLPKILDKLDESDALIITADHGNDPTTPSTDHSREYVPLLYYRKGKFGEDLGIRDSFADVGKTVAEFFDVQNYLDGTSFHR